MMRRTLLKRAAAASNDVDVSVQWPFGRPEARGTQRKYIPYPKKTLEGLAAKMADKKQDPPTLVSICNHLSGLGKGWKIARNHWNLDGEIRTFATITEIHNHRPPYEASQAIGYMTVNGETSNCPVYIPQQHYSGWTALQGPVFEEINHEFTSRTGKVVDFSNKLCVSGIDYTTPLSDLENTFAEYGEVLHCDWMHEAYDKATRQVLVIFDTAAAAEEVYNSLHDEVLDGMRISVEPGVLMVPRPPSIGTDVPVDYSFGKMPTEPSFNW